MYSLHPNAISVGSFNILADGFSSNEFLCDGGDNKSTRWNQRRDRLVQVLSKMLKECDVVVTQENDHFFGLLDGIREETNMSIGGILHVHPSSISKARKLKVQWQYEQIVGNGGVLLDGDNQIKGFREQYEYCNDCFQRTRFGSDIGISYNEESPYFGELLATYHGKSPQDLYQADDGIGIFYRIDTLKLLDAGLIGVETHANTVTSHGDVTVIHSTDLKNTETNTTATLEKCIRASFSLISDVSKVITLYGAHLKSGEGVHSENLRCSELEAILQDAVDHPNVIIAMDSNNSVNYEIEYTMIASEPKSDCFSQNHIDTNIEQFPSITKHSSNFPLSAVIKNYGFVDAVGHTHQTFGNECFKMRHGRGGQPSKHFQFMFDAIDKILVKDGTPIQPVAYERDKFGFLRYSPDLREQLTTLRTSERNRKELEAACRASERVCSTTCSVEAFGLGHMLAQLYPNPNAPSDHPPVHCCIYI